MKWLHGLGILGCAVVFGLLVGLFQSVSADRFQSTNYTIDASVGNSLGGSSSSTNYKLVSSGGESIIGEGSGGSYKLGTGYVAQLQKSMQITVQPSDLIAYYSIDETTGGVVYDQSTNNYHARITGSPTRNPTGLIGQSITVGPTTTNGVMTTETSFGNPTQFTACAWVYYTTAGTNPSLVARGNGGLDTNGMWVLGLNAGTGARAQIRLNGVTTTITGTNAVTPNAWTQLCETYDGSTFILYANGVEVASSVINQALPAVSHVLSIGGKSNMTAAQLPNPVDEVKYFSRALTPKEIKAGYDAGAAGNPTGISLNTVTPGASQTANLSAIMQTDAPGYGLATNQTQNLTSGGNTIPAVSGSIASPVAWSEGSTKGLGFTLTGTNATAIPGNWSSGNAYAAFPGSATTFYTRTGYSGGTKDYVNVRLRLDVNSSQAAGDYTNTVIWTGTMTP